MSRAIVMFSKSTWEPAIRREHAFARLAAERGHTVLFVERPSDVRDIRALGARRYVAGLRGAWQPRRVAPRLWVAPRAALVPGHRSELAERLDAAGLRRLCARWLPRLASEVSIVVCTPWQWRAARAVPRARVVFDSADDWSSIMPARAGAFAERLAEVSAGADAAMAVSPHLAGLFTPPATVVANGVAPDLLVPLGRVGDPTRLVYTGTLSERLDLGFLDRLLTDLPDWTLDLHGPCQYAGRGDRPGEDLAAFLARWEGRVTWGGVVPRERLAEAIDRAAVALVPFVPPWAGDVMKLYDYAARGRPIVTTRWQTDGRSLPPHVYPATAETAAAAVRAAAREPESNRDERRRWAERQSWEARWDAWSTCVLGEPEPERGGDLAGVGRGWA